jgi:hypothetical protein
VAVLRDHFSVAGWVIDLQKSVAPFVPPHHRSIGVSRTGGRLRLLHVKDFSFEGDSGGFTVQHHRQSRATLAQIFKVLWLWRFIWRRGSLWTRRAWILLARYPKRGQDQDESTHRRKHHPESAEGFQPGLLVAFPFSSGVIGRLPNRCRPGIFERRCRPITFDTCRKRLPILGVCRTLEHRPGTTHRIAPTHPKGSIPCAFSNVAHKGRSPPRFLWHRREPLPEPWRSLPKPIANPD